MGYPGTVSVFLGHTWYSVLKYPGILEYMPYIPNLSYSGMPGYHTRLFGSYPVKGIQVSPGYRSYQTWLFGVYTPMSTRVPKEYRPYQTCHTRVRRYRTYFLGPYSGSYPGIHRGEYPCTPRVNNPGTPRVTTRILPEVNTRFLDVSTRVLLEYRPDQTRLFGLYSSHYSSILGLIPYKVCHTRVPGYQTLFLGHTRDGTGAPLEVSIPAPLETSIRVSLQYRPYKTCHKRVRVPGYPSSILYPTNLTETFKTVVQPSRPSSP